MKQLPCPFCGADAGELQTMPGQECLRHSVFCGDCLCEGPTAYNQQRAIELWNRRASLQAAIQQQEAPPQEFFCNKCGYFGPAQVFHQRPNGSGRCDYMAAPMKAPATLSAAPPSQPSGWKLVPMQPTTEMIDAGAEHTLRVVDVDPDDERAMKDARYTARGCAIAAYMDMLTAVAPPPIEPQGELSDALIDAHLGLAYDASGLNGMTGVQWDHLVARRFYNLGMAVMAGVIPPPPIEGKEAQSDYRNPELDHQAEDWECAMKCLDDRGVPRADEGGAVYSLWGRIVQFAASPSPLEQPTVEHEKN